MRTDANFAFFASECPLLAQSGHELVHCPCPLSGVKRTWLIAPHMSAFDPKRTLRVLLQRLKVRLEPNLRYQGRHDSAADYCRKQDSVLLLIDDVIG